MTEIDVDSIPIAQVGTPSSIEGDLYEVVELIPDVVLSFGPTVIAAQLCNERLRLYVLDPHRLLSKRKSPGSLFPKTYSEDSDGSAVHCCRRPTLRPGIAIEPDDARVRVAMRAASTTGFGVLQTSSVTCTGRTDRPQDGSRSLNGRSRERRSNDRCPAARPTVLDPLPSFASTDWTPDTGRSDRAVHGHDPHVTYFSIMPVAGRGKMQGEDRRVARSARD